MDLNNSARRRRSFRLRDWERRSKIRSLYTSYIDTRIAYSVFGLIDTERSLISGKFGSADGRWGRLRLGTLGVKWGSCRVLPKRILACFLGVFPKGSWDGRGRVSGPMPWEGIGTVGFTFDFSSARGEDPTSRLRMDHWL